MTATFSKIALAAALIAASTAPVAVQAQQVAVSYHPYELQTLSGQRAVLNRIEASAKRVCLGERTLAEVSASKRCTVALTSQIVGNMHNPQMTAMLSGNSATKIASR